MKSKNERMQSRKQRHEKPRQKQLYTIAGFFSLLIILIIFFFVWIIILTNINQKINQKENYLIKSHLNSLVASVIEEETKIILNKKTFLPYETIQIEISGSFISDITASDVIIKKGNVKMPVLFYVEKIAKNVYFAYALLSLTSGKYNVTITTREKYGVNIYEHEIEIKETNNKFYQDFYNDVKDRWYALSNKELIYAIQAITSIDEAQEKKATDEILRRINYFNDEEKLLALLLIESKNEMWLLQKSRLMNYFILQQDNNIGSFKISINTTAKFICQSEQIPTGLENPIENSKEISVELLKADKINITITCAKLENNVVVNAKAEDLNKIDVKLIKTYIASRIYNFNKKIETSEINNSFIVFSLSKEFGSLKEDVNLTSLLLLVFLKNNVDERHIIEWLIKHKNENLLANIALGAINDVDAINFVMMMQEQSGLIKRFGNFTSGEISCLAYKYSNIPTLSLLKTAIIEKFYGFSFKEKALCLNLVLEKQNILAVLPGIIKTKTGDVFNIYLMNKGISDFDVILQNQLLNLNHTVKLEKGKTKKIDVGVGSIIYEEDYIRDKIDIYYVFDSYHIPLIIFIERINISNISQNVSVNISNITIEENVTIDIIKKNETIKEEIPSLIEVYKITPETIEVVVINKTNLSIKIKNVGNRDISNIFISHSADLIGVVQKIQPELIPVLKPGREVELTITFKKDIADYYKGKIIVTGFIEGKKYEKEIETKVETKVKEITLKSCSEMNGKICKPGEECIGTLKNSAEGICCIGTCKGKPKVKTFIIVFLIIVVIIALYLIFIIKKKPREKKIEEVLKKIEEREKGKIERTK